MQFREFIRRGTRFRFVTEQRFPGENGMSNSGSSSGDVFDVRKIRRLVALMNEHELSELDLRQADTRIRIRRGPEQITTSGPVPAAFAAPASAALPAEAATPAPPAKASEDHLLTVRSPMVGTFYVSPNPESPAFIKVGDQVQADTVVCIIEAMKVFNEIPAGVSGKVVSILVENQAAVDFDHPLFKVDPT